MEISELTKVLAALGCPAEKSAEMAAQTGQARPPAC